MKRNSMFLAIVLMALALLVCSAAADDDDACDAVYEAGFEEGILAASADCDSLATDECTGDFNGDGIVNGFDQADRRKMKQRIFYLWAETCYSPSTRSATDRDDDDGDDDDGDDLCVQSYKSGFTDGYISGMTACSALTACEADANGDGEVNKKDLQYMRKEMQEEMREWMNSCWKPAMNPL